MIGPTNQHWSYTWDNSSLQYTHHQIKRALYSSRQINFNSIIEGNNFGINEYVEVMIQKEPYLLHK
jgi:hypothetical protein